MSISNSPISTNQLDSDLLRTFIAITESGSFTQGANRISRSQSAVSLQMKRLEEILGQAVFVRRSRGIALTTTGEKLHPIARQIVNTLDTAIGQLRVDALTGSIQLGIPDEYGTTVLPDVIARFTRNHPQVEIEVQCGFSAKFPDALARKKLDIAVYAVESPVKGAEVLRKEATHWVASTKHLVHAQDPVPIALFDRACWWRDTALEALDRSGKRYRVVYTSESVTGVLAAISAGVAVGLLSESSLSDDKRVLTKADGFPKLPHSALVLEHRGSAESPLLAAMILAIKQAFKQ